MTCKSTFFRPSDFIYSFTLCNLYYLTYIIITCFSLNSNCLSCAISVASSLSSIKTMHSVRVSDSHFRLLKWETPTFISSGLWLQHPDLNPLHYKICTMLWYQCRYWVLTIHHYCNLLVTGYKCYCRCMLPDASNCCSKCLYVCTRHKDPCTFLHW